MLKSTIQSELRSVFKTSLFTTGLLLSTFAAAQERAELPPEFQNIQNELYESSFQNFWMQMRAAHSEYQMNTTAPQPPPLEPEQTREEWLTQFADRAATSLTLNPAQNEAFRFQAKDMFTSYNRDQGYARLPFLTIEKSFSNNSEIQNSEALPLPQSYPKNHSLDVQSYVAERFPTALQTFVRKFKVPLYYDDSNCSDAFATQRKNGYTNGIRFMGGRESAESQFLFVYNKASSRNYRLVICQIIGKDDATRMSAILGPIFYPIHATLLHHKTPAPILKFNHFGQSFKVNPAKDTVVIGFQNTIWWHLKSSSPDWERIAITDSGVEASVFANKKSGLRLLSVANIYGDEMLKVMKVLQDKGFRRWIYLGSAGGLAANLKLGDLILPTRFLKPNGEWFNFRNQLANEIGNFPSTLTGRANSREGWVATLIQENFEFLTGIKEKGIDAIDVESRYFAEFLLHNESLSKQMALVISDAPLGNVNYNAENVTRQSPMKTVVSVFDYILSKQLK